MIKNKSFFMSMKKVPTATAQEKQYSAKFKTLADGTRKAVTQVYLSEGAKNARYELNTALWRVIDAKGWNNTHALQKNVPVCLKTSWCFGIESQADGKPNHVEGEWHTRKPDTDNLIKGLKDLMTDAGCFWEDDAQICMEQTMKYWSNTPGIFVEVFEMSSED